MTQPKIKLLIPIEIKDGCELPERNKDIIFIDSDGYKSTGYLNVGNIIRTYDCGNFNFYSGDFSYWLKEVETDLTIDELKKIGVIK